MTPPSIPVPRLPKHPVSLHRIRLTMLLALVAVATYCMFSQLADQAWHQQHPGSGASDFVSPPWMSVSWILFLLAPYVASLILLSTRNAKSTVAGAGIATGFFGMFLAASPFMFAGLILAFGLSQAPYGLQTAISVLVFLLIGVWIVVSGVRIGNMNWPVFMVAVAVTCAYGIQGRKTLMMAQYRLGRKHEQQKAQDAIDMFKPTVDAQHQLASLAGCLILNQSVHPKDGYPLSLETPPADWSCETKFDTDGVKGYDITYTPLTDRTSGLVKDFQLTAIPLEKGIRAHYPLMVDSRGVLFSDANWSITSSHFIKAATSEQRFAEIDQLKTNIDHYMVEKVLAEAPATLNPEIIGTAYGFYVPTIESGGTSLDIKNYAITYLPPKAERPASYAISVQCQSYGKDCLRSYFLDYEGVIHATGEPRQATADDPLALDCEGSDAQCKGVEPFAD
jgi:hypothetical protein